MVLFFTIGAVGFLYVLLTSVIGHTHDLAHDVVSDIAHGDFGRDTGGSEHESGHITSIFSARVIATFLMGFGGAGGVAMYYNLGYPLSSLIGVVAGALVGALMFFLLEFFARQQANSLVETKSLVGSFGTVQIAIDGDRPGEVAVSFAGRYGTYVARSQRDEAIDKGSRVKVVETVGSDLIVEQA